MTIKQNIASVFIIAALTSCGGGSSDTSTGTPVDQPEGAYVPTSGKYKIKSGKIEFIQEGSGLKMEKKVYFDDYGAKERVEQYNIDGVLREINISDGKMRYTLIIEDKQAYFVDENGSRGWEMEFTPWEKIVQQGKYAERYKKAENLTLVGKDCESFYFDEKTRFAGWNGLTLLVDQGTTSKMEATSLEENISIPADQFTVPADYEVIKTR